MNARNVNTVTPQAGNAELVRDAQSGHLRGISHGGKFSRMIAPAVGAGWTAVIETIVVMVVAMVIFKICSPGDPLFIHKGFPYAWLLPLIIALRYGTLIGLLSGALLAAGWGIFYGMNADSALGASSFDSAFFLGGLLVLLIGGQFGDIWGNRLRRAQATNAYLSDRFSALSKNHFLLRLSHERLENDLLSNPTTLRDALTQLRRMAFDQQRQHELMPAAEQLMQMTAQACQLESAALFGAKHDEPFGRALASVGQNVQLDPSDPMLKMCLERKALMHVQSEEIRDVVRSRYLACVPVLSGAEELLGVLVVEQMPFVALTHENLQFLLVLLGYYADGVRQNDTTHEIMQNVPSCPFEFALDYGRLARLQRQTGVESRIVGLIFGPHPMQEAISSHVMRGMRALDLIWTIHSDGAIGLFLLMPLSGESALAGYLLRMEQSIQAQFGLDFENANVHIQSLAVGPQHAGVALAGLIDRCRLHV